MAAITQERLREILVGLLREKKTPMCTIGLSRLTGAATPSECFQALSVEDLKDCIEIVKGHGASTFRWVGP